MRKDATERRGRIIASAGRLFQEHGYDVPLEDIAEDAGVGRGTLYRNFADRSELALAIFGREVERLEHLSSNLSDDPEGLFELIRALADIMAVNMSLARAVHMEGRPDPFLQLAARRDRAVERPLRLAIANDRVRSDFTVDDACRAAMMIAAPAEFASHDDRDAAIDASLRLLREGMQVR